MEWGLAGTGICSAATVVAATLKHAFFCKMVSFAIGSKIRGIGVIIPQMSVVRTMRAFLSYRFVSLVLFPARIYTKNVVTSPDLKKEIC